MANTRHAATRLPPLILNLLTITMVNSCLFPLAPFLALSACLETAPRPPPPNSAIARLTGACFGTGMMKAVCMRSAIRIAAAE